MAENNPSLRWYQKGWVIALLGLGVFVLFAGGYFAVLTAQYWYQIKHGGGAALEQKFYGGFSAQDASKEGKQVKVDRAALETGMSPYKGNAKAAIVIVEFVDFKCPNCLAAAPILDELVDKYAFKVKLIQRNFPIESLHPGTEKLAEIAQCAQDQGKYWEMHDVLFAGQDSLPAQLAEDDIQNLSDQAGLDYDKLAKCLLNPQTAAKVNIDYNAAANLDVAGTPTFFVNGDKVEGVVPLQVWENFVKNY